MDRTTTSAEEGQASVSGANAPHGAREEAAIRRLAQAIDVFLCKAGGSPGARMRRYDVLREARAELENEAYDVLVGLQPFEIWPTIAERTERLRPGADAPHPSSEPGREPEADASKPSRGAGEGAL